MRKALFTLCVLVMVALFFGSCNKSSDPSGAYSVTMAGMTFSPTTLTITAGSTVTWTNNDGSTVHNVTSTGSTFVSSGPLSPGSKYSLQFNTKGTYQYSCTIHPTMMGTIVVQ